MKKISMILMAFALAMMMSQCKKNEGQTTSNDEVVTIKSSGESQYRHGRL